MVHRGLRHARSEGGEGAAGGVGDRERLIEVLGIGSEIIQRKEWYSGVDNAAAPISAAGSAMKDAEIIVRHGNPKPNDLQLMSRVVALDGEIIAGPPAAPFVKRLLAGNTQTC